MAAPDKPERIPHIDGLRGYLIFSMTMSHLGIIGPNMISGLSHKSVSTFYTGEGFMTISGLMMGLILCNRTRTNGALRTLANSTRRSFKIYRYYIAVFALCALTTLVFAAQKDPLLSSLFRERSPLSLDAALLFATGVYRPLMFDILFLYIVLIGISPLLIGLVLKRGPQVVLGLSVASWLAVQYGLVTKAFEKLGGALGFDSALLFGNFSLFSWQLPFVVGLLAGMTLADTPTSHPSTLPNCAAPCFPPPWRYAAHLPSIS